MIENRMRDNGVQTLSEKGNEYLRCPHNTKPCGDLLCKFKALMDLRLGMTGDVNWFTNRVQEEWNDNKDKTPADRTEILRGLFRELRTRSQKEAIDFLENNPDEKFRLYKDNRKINIDSIWFKDFVNKNTAEAYTKNYERSSKFRDCNKHMSLVMSETCKCGASSKYICRFSNLSKFHEIIQQNTDISCLSDASDIEAENIKILTIYIMKIYLWFNEQSRHPPCLAKQDEWLSCIDAQFGCGVNRYLFAEYVFDGIDRKNGDIDCSVEFSLCNVMVMRLFCVIGSGDNFMHAFIGMDGKDSYIYFPLTDKDALILSLLDKEDKDNRWITWIAYIVVVALLAFVVVKFYKSKSKVN